MCKTVRSTQTAIFHTNKCVTGMLGQDDAGLQCGCVHGGLVGTAFPLIGITNNFIKYMYT